MSKQEWIERFATQFCKVSKHPKKVALLTAKAAWSDRDEDTTPEESADAEYSYWAADDPIQ